MKSKDFQHAFKASLPISVAYFVLALGFGIMMQAKGYNWLWSLGTSIFVYSGSIQFMAPILLSSQAGLISTAILTLMVNFRLMFYGISQLERYKNVGWRKFYLIHSLTDETFSIVCNDHLPVDLNRKNYYLYVSMLNHFYWIVGGLVGNLVGDRLPFSTEGVDFALTALFFVVVLNQWEATDNHKPAIYGIIFSIIFFLIIGPNNFMLPTMMSVIMVLLTEKRLRGGRPEYV
ncbi:AzlC family ABC transporter permease [Facklamia sp. DSM 111018]|uniref:AzlC family ABC transporter permease n=1 Tax=Facklamia lactis TaxID=2749967 RepID=A0ABS0LS47_9LACT|nr:AzlC family ABC transporter permease [Facklamia lactis]MBG9986990.1 AzlC family ABC transporter permease [Facklamia lactis]